MSTDRFHKAAKDGLLDVLKEATRKDANFKDDDSMTPVLWTAFEGHLEALRLLCGRGGDPDKCDQFGNTALHLASAKGHLRCVDFLVKFGVNIYALDIDKHSAKDLAAINNRDEILRYLDAATASFEIRDRKRAKAMKDVADKNCEKRIKDYMKRQQKLDQELREFKSSNALAGGGKSGKMLSTLKQKIWSSQGNLHKVTKEDSLGSKNVSTNSGGVKFSELVKTGSSGCGDSVASRKGSAMLKKETAFEIDNGFKIGEMEPDGRRTITSLSGVHRDTEVLYVGSFSSHEDHDKRGKISSLFEVEERGISDNDHVNSKGGYGTLSRSFSQPDILADNEASEYLRAEMPLQRPAVLFDRPMLGSIAFRRSVTAALSQLNSDTYSMDQDTSTRTNSINSKSRSGKQRSFLNLTDSDSDGGEGYSDDDDDDDDQNVAGGPIQRFLAAWGLEEYLSIFQKQQIDLDTLLLLTEADLKSLGLPLGPFRKLSFAIQERKNALVNPGIMKDSRL